MSWMFYKCVTPLPFIVHSCMVNRFSSSHRGSRSALTRQVFSKVKQSRRYGNSFPNTAPLKDTYVAGPVFQLASSGVKTLNTGGISFVQTPLDNGRDQGNPL